MTRANIQFLIGGVQKGGTTALASFLSRHPEIALPRGKEAHVFDAPDFDESWQPEHIDKLYAPHFDVHIDKVCGDATPIYCFHPEFVRRIAAYNPDMRWIIMLRHPVERAVSQYRMERRRGDEKWPFWPAMLLENWRLRGHADDFSMNSPLRHHSYRARGDYARQLDALYARFPREQVLLLRNHELSREPAKVMEQVWRFLGISTEVTHGEYGRVFEGGYQPLSRSGFRFRMLSRLMAPALLRARYRHGLDWR